MVEINGEMVCRPWPIEVTTMLSAGPSVVNKLAIIGATVVPMIDAMLPSTGKTAPTAVDIELKNVVSVLMP